MKHWLAPHLICPGCLASQVPLTLEIEKEHDGDVREGRLVCPQCQAIYLIRDGIAVVVPEKTLPVVYDKTGYNSQGMLSAYLWSHYSEFFNGPDATDAYKIWASCFEKSEGWAVDIGCSVGRLSFELSKTHPKVVGLDTSFVFVKEARNLLRKKELLFDMVVEGRITREKSCALEAGYRFDHVEFIVADAMALPFVSNAFSTAASINILEKVPDPGHHLKEVNRVLQPENADFLFSDPFSWDEAVSSPDLWLGGRSQGPFKGRGLDNMIRLMSRDPQFFNPLFSIREKGEVLWKIRKTQNLWEYITSQFLIGKRA